MQLRRQILHVQGYSRRADPLVPLSITAHRLLDPQLAEGFVPEPPSRRSFGSSDAPRHGYSWSRRSDRAVAGDQRGRACWRSHPRAAGFLLIATAAAELARADEGFLLALGYSSQRGYGRSHPFAGEIRFGEVEVEFFAEDAGFAVPGGPVVLTECQMVNQFKGSATEAPCFTRGYGLAFGQSERKKHVDGAGRSNASCARIRRRCSVTVAGRGVRDVAFRQCAGNRLCRASQAPHTSIFSLNSVYCENSARSSPKRRTSPGRCGRPPNECPAYNFAYLDEQTKRMIRGATRNAIAIRVPGAVREP